jgi:hypothetical protein
MPKSSIIDVKSSDFRKIFHIFYPFLGPITYNLPELSNYRNNLSAITISAFSPTLCNARLLDLDFELPGGLIRVDGKDWKLRTDKGIYHCNIELGINLSLADIL